MSAIKQVRRIPILRCKRPTCLWDSSRLLLPWSCEKKTPRQIERSQSFLSEKEFLYLWKDRRKLQLQTNSMRVSIIYCICLNTCIRIFPSTREDGACKHGFSSTWQPRLNIDTTPSSDYG
ncbi:hypothetical protein KC345_g35 [Hortaea werneckii]|nr:hypothetical protein KC345_g35 [Hortaea werneckii]